MTRIFSVSLGVVKNDNRLFVLKLFLSLRAEERGACLPARLPRNDIYDIRIIRMPFAFISIAVSV